MLLWWTIQSKRFSRASVDSSHDVSVEQSKKKNADLMGSEKKEMGAKDAPGAPSAPNSTSASLLTGVFDVDGRATGHVTRPLFCV